MCPKFCMLYYYENTGFNKCETCGHARYKPKTDRGRTLIAYRKIRCFLNIPRLQRLFMSLKNAMT